jgi:hypothetical protein
MSQVSDYPTNQALRCRPSVVCLRLLLLVNGVRRLLLTVSAFTLSHTVTLTLATLGFVNVPPAPVETVIALSILFVAYEVLRKNENPSSLSQRKPWLVAFSFGLLHGLGFAGGLSAAGLPGPFPSSQALQRKKSLPHLGG